MKILSAFLKVILLITIIFFILNVIDKEIFLSTFSKLDYFFLVFVFLSIILFLYLESLIFYILLINQNIKIDIKTNFMILNFTYLFNFIFPFSGMAWRAFFLKKKYHLDFKDYGKIILYFLLFELSLVFSILSLIIINYYINIYHLYSLSASFFVFLFLYLFYFYLLKKKFKIRNIIQIFCLSLLLIFFYYVGFYLSFLSLGVSYPIESLIVSLTASFANYFSVTPSSVGISEGVVVFVSNFLSVLPEESLIAALIVRISILLSVLFFSLLFINHLKSYIQK